MKKSISHLPSTNQRDLHYLVESILSRVKQAEMIILFGSYARNDFVVYDEKYEFGKIQFYVSDYDILVVTSGISDGIAGKAIYHYRYEEVEQGTERGQVFLYADKTGRCNSI